MARCPRQIINQPLIDLLSAKAQPPSKQLSAQECDIIYNAVINHHLITPATIHKYVYCGGYIINLGFDSNDEKILSLTLAKDPSDNAQPRWIVDVYTGYGDDGNFTGDIPEIIDYLANNYNIHLTTIKDTN